MNNSIQSSIEKNSYELIFLIDPIKNKQSSQNINKYIDIPLICPICGSKNIFNSVKIKPRYYVFPKRRDFYVYRNSLRIYFCEKHSISKIKSTMQFLLSFFLMSFSPLIIFIFIYYTLRMELFGLTLSAISFGVGLSGFLYNLKKDKSLNSMIRKNLFFEYYPSIGIIMSIKFTEWATKFKGSNNSYSIKNINLEKLTNLEKLGLKYERNMNFSLKLLLISFIGIFLSLVFFVKIIPVYLLIGFSLSIVFVILCIYLYEFYLNDLMQKQRSQIFKEFKLNNRL